MSFVREIKTEYISETDDVWIDNPFKEKDDKEKIHIVGTRVICTVRDEETGLSRSTSFLIPPGIGINERESQELIEEHYQMCEHSLKSDLKKISDSGEALELKSNEFRAQNIV